MLKVPLCQSVFISFLHTFESHRIQKVGIHHFTIVLYSRGGTMYVLVLDEITAGQLKPSRILFIVTDKVINSS